MTRPRRARRRFELPLGEQESLAALVDLELEQHLEMRIEELTARGHAPEDARRLARAAFGDLERHRAACLAEGRMRAGRKRRLERLSGVATDARRALRGLRKSPGYAATVVLTLALGIGANAAIFTVVDAMLIRSIPYSEPDELYELRTWYTQAAYLYPFVRPEAAFALREEEEIGARLHVHARMNVLLTGIGEPRSVAIQALAPGLTDALGERPLLGRGFVEEDAVPGATRVVLLSHAFWVGELGGDPDVVGRALPLDGEPATVVGVMPPGFRFPYDTGTPFWVPLATDGTALGRRTQLEGILRAPAGESEVVRARLEAFARAQSAAAGPTAAWEPRLEPMNAPSGSPELRRGLWVLFGAVGIMFLVALVNGTNLTLAHTSARAREFGVRVALGAARSRLVVPLLIESLLLALVAGAAASALTWFGVDALLALAPDDLTYWARREIDVDGRTMVFTFGLALSAALALGLLPALAAVRASNRTGLQLRGAHAVTGRQGRRFRGALVVVQVAASLTLLFGAGLLGRSFSRMIEQDPGFEPEGLVAAFLSVPVTMYPTPAERTAHVERIAQQLARLPGVDGITRTCCVPPYAGILFADGLWVDGRQARAEPREVGMSNGDEGWRRVLGIELLAGNDLSPTEDGVENVLVTRALAGVLADGGDAVGTLFRIEEDGTDHRVVGVVENVELAGLESPWGEEGIIYLSDPARGPTSPVFVLRTSGDPRALLPLVRGMIAEIDPNQPVTRLAPVEDLMWEATLRPRFFLALMSTFALVALLLAAVGLYGLLSISVGQRRREIGVRAALGAERRGIHALIMANGLRLVVVGILIGAALSYYSSRVLDELLFETSRTDLLTLAVVASTMLAVASLASWVPARRATRVDPMEVLREE